MENFRNNTKIIKKVLSNIFGYKNVSVKKEAGTTMDWIVVKIKVKNECNCGGFMCLECNKKRLEVRSKVYNLIKKSGVELSCYYNDENIERDALIIDVKFCK